MGDSRNKNAEQKTAEQKLVGTLGHWVMGKCKKVRRTKTVEQNWWGPLGTLSASTERSAEQKCGTKSAEQKFGGDPEGP